MAWQVLLSSDQYELALLELKQLVEMAPKEGSVYFVLGKVRRPRVFVCSAWSQCAFRRR